MHPRAIQLSVFLGIFAQGSRAQLAPTVKRPQSKNRNYGRIECLCTHPISDRLTEKCITGKLSAETYLK